MKYQHLFFDWDHTLWDFEANSKVSLQKLFQCFSLSDKGVRQFEDFYTVYSKFNRLMWEKYQQGGISRDELKWKRMSMAMMHFNIYNESLAKDLSAHYLELLPLQGQLMPFAEDVLLYCKQKGYVMHLITNGFHDTQFKKIASSRVGSYFQEVITSEHCNSLKPHADIFKYALDVATTSKEKSIMIGDNLDADILGAQAFGMAQIFFNPEKVKHTQSPTYEVHCLSELKNIL